MTNIVNYEVMTVRSGQPRAYADTEREYVVKVTSCRYGSAGMYPWVMHGNIEAQIMQEAEARAAGRLHGGYAPDELRKQQRDWALRIVRALCGNFREKTDQDGRTGMEAHFYPTLKRLNIDPIAGTLHVLIIEPYTD